MSVAYTIRRPSEINNVDLAFVAELKSVLADAIRPNWLNPVPPTHSDLKRLVEQTARNWQGRESSNKQYRAAYMVDCVGTMVTVRQSHSEFVVAEVELL